MKKFSFSLDRVLGFRRSECEMEQAALGKLLSERDELSRRTDTLRDGRTQYQTSLAHALYFDGGSVPTLPHWHARVNRSLSELAAQRDQLTVRVQQQQERVRAADLRVKLLEKLRERRLSDWKAALNLDGEAQAAEAYLARFARLKRSIEAGA